MYVSGVNSTVTKHSDNFVWKDTSERVARRCDDTVDKKRVTGVVQFVSQDKGFVIWHFRNYCLVQIVSLWSLSIGVGIIVTTNELADRIRNLKSYASHKKKIIKKMRRKPDFLWNKMRRRHDLWNKMRRRPDVLTKS